MFLLPRGMCLKAYPAQYFFLTFDKIKIILYLREFEISLNYDIEVKNGYYKYY